MRTTSALITGALLSLFACQPPAPPAAPDLPAPVPAAATALPDTVGIGHQQVRASNGRLLMEGDVRGGKRNGLWTSYHPNGAVQSRNEYRDGVLHGLTTTFRPNGALLYRGQNANGHAVGTWEFHDGIGTLDRTVEYDSTGTLIKKS